MSSFRPDTQTEAPRFIPLGFVSTDSLAEPSESRAFAARSPAGDSPSGASGVPRDARREGQATAEEIERLQAFENAAFERGVESAREADERLSRICDGLEEAILRVDRAARTSVGANRELVLLLATEIAGRWVGEELSLDPARFGAALDRAIEACTPQAGVRLALHPEDLDAIRAADPARVTAWENTATLTLVPRPDLARGAFEVDAGTVRVDGRRDAILSSLRDALSVALDEAAPEGEEEPMESPS